MHAPWNVCHDLPEVTEHRDLVGAVSHRKQRETSQPMCDELEMRVRVPSRKRQELEDDVVHTHLE